MQVRAEDIVELGEWLGEHEFKVSPQQLVAAARLAASARAPRDAAALQDWLAPIFCTVPQQQQDFAALYGKWLGARGVRINADEPANSGGAVTPLAPLGRQRWRLAAGVVLVVLALGALVLLAERHQPRELLVLVRGAKGPLAGAQASGDHAPGTVLLTDERGQVLLPYTRAYLPFTIAVRHPTARDASNQPAAVSQLIESPPAGAVQLTFDEATPPPELQRAGVTWLRALLPPPVQSADSSVVEHHPDRVQLGLLALLAALPMLWWLAERWRRRAFLQRLPADDDTTAQLLRAEASRPLLALQAELRHLARELRRRVVLPSRQLDLPSTLRATLRRGGDVRLMFGTRTEPEHLVLIDRTSYKDHQARLADEVVAALHGHGVMVERYVFDGSLAHCHHAPLEGPVLHGVSQTLERLAGRHPDARLLVFSDGRGLVDPMTGLPGAALETLQTWPQPVLVTTQTRSRWGAREWLLARAGVVLVAMDSAGLRDLGDLYASSREPTAVDTVARDRVRSPHLRAAERLLDRRALDAQALRTLLAGLRAELEAGTYAWLCACAVYPEIHWGITMAVGDALAGTHPATAGRSRARLLAELSRLPWMRRGYMPDWLRTALVGELDRASAKAVQHALASYLGALADEGRARADADALAVAVSAQDAAPWRDALARLRRLWSRMTGGGPHPPAPSSHDLVFLRFMSGRQQPLAVAAVDRLLRLLYHEGVPLMGPRALLPLAVVLATGAAALWGTPPIETVRSVRGPVVRPSPSVLVLNSDGTLLALADDHRRISALRVQDGVVTAGVSLAASANVLHEVPRLAWDGAVLRHAEVQPDVTTAAPADGPITVTPLRTATRYGPQPTMSAAASSANPQRVPLALQTTSDRVTEGSIRCAAYDAARRQFIAFDESGPLFTLLKDRRVVTCAVSAGSRTLAVLDDRGGVALLPLQRYDAAVARDGLQQVATVQDAGATLAVSDDGRTIALRRRDGQVVLLRGAERRQEVLPADGGGPLALSGDGRVLAHAQADRQVQLYRLEPGRGRDLLFTNAWGAAAPQALRDLTDVLTRRYGFEAVPPTLSADPQGQWDRTAATLAADDRLLLVGMPPGDVSGPLSAATVERLTRLPARQLLVVLETARVAASKDTATATAAGGGARARLLLTSPGPGLVSRLTAVLAAATGPVAATSLPDLLDRDMPLPVTRSAVQAAPTPVNLDFVEADIADVTRAMEVIVNLPIDVDPRVRGAINVKSTQAMSRAQAWLAYQAALRRAGYVVADTGSRLRVVPRAAAVLQRWAAAGHEGGDVVLVPTGAPIETLQRWDAVPRPSAAPPASVAAAQSTETGSGADGDAEYAVRWDPRQGGPATPEEALRELQLKASEPSRFDVQFFEFTAPAGLLPGFDAILRKRTGAGQAELTFKLHGTTPLPATPSLKDWPCPLGATRDRRDEADVTFVGGGQVLKAFSRSCDVNSRDLDVQPPATLQARLKGCKSTMTRLRAGKLKVEQWQLADGSTLLEASRPGRHDDNAQRAFERDVLQPLMRLKVQPLNRSKSAIGGDC